MGWSHLKILFLRTMKPEKAELLYKAFWYRTKASWLKSWAPEGRMWKMEMHNYYYISVWVKVTQVSDVAHGPLVYNM
jgi:hypothetical protein